MFKAANADSALTIPDRRPRIRSRGRQQRRAAQCVATVNRLAQQAQEFGGLRRVEAAHHDLLRALYGGLDAIEKVGPGLGDLQRPRAAVGRMRLARQQAALRQAVDHAAHRRAVEGDEAGQRRLIHAGMGVKRRQRRILHRRQVEAGRRDLGVEHRDGDLLKPAGEKPGLVVHPHFIFLRRRY